jgi:hypothetical protein
MISSKNVANIVYDESSNKYKVSIEFVDVLKPAPVSVKMASDTDYFGESFGVIECFSGPFKKVQPGKNEILLSV